jgi:tetratricopeptide (TPR) repeat protein
VILFVAGTVIPFDVALVRGIPYRTDGAGEPIEVEAAIAAIAAQLEAARQDPHDDSPIFQLVDVLPHSQIEHTKTDVFRAQIDYSKKYKQRLAEAVRAGAEAVEKIAAEPALGNLNEVETGVVVDLYLSMRDVKSYQSMIRLYERMPPPLQRAKMMREQLGFAFNREGRFEEAEKVLKEVIAEYGPSSETNALLGRIYKDRWDLARKDGRPEARGLLRRAIDTYLDGFQADWRDAYPGVNAVSLMEMQDRRDPRQAQVLPVVRYSVNRKKERSADYWDYATLIELAVLANDRNDAEEQLGEAIAVARAAWEVESTARNLGLIRKVRLDRGEDAAWIEALEAQLLRAAKELAVPKQAS